jgi:hypothetical protein
MKKPLLLIIIIAVLFIIAGGFYYTRSTAPTISSDGIVSTTLSDILKKGQNYACTFGYDDTEDSTYSGTMYIAADGNKMRAEFLTILPDGQQVTSHMLSDGEYSYTWTDQYAQGYKTKLSSEDLAEMDFYSEFIDEDGSFSGGSELDSDVNYSCKPWRVDNSKFVAPSNVQFIDLSDGFGGFETP